MANWILGLLKQLGLEGPRSQRERRYREVSSHLAPIFPLRHFLILKLGSVRGYEVEQKADKKQAKVFVCLFLF